LCKVVSRYLSIRITPGDLDFWGNLIPGGEEPYALRCVWGRGFCKLRLHERKEGKEERGHRATSPLLPSPSFQGRELSVWRWGSLFIRHWECARYFAPAVAARLGKGLGQRGSLACQRFLPAAAQSWEPYSILCCALVGLGGTAAGWLLASCGRFLSSYLFPLEAGSFPGAKPVSWERNPNPSQPLRV
jgi:hypothetical protein